MALSSQSLTVLLLWYIVMINGCFRRAAFTLWSHYENIMYEKTVINIHYNCKLLSWMLMESAQLPTRSCFFTHCICTAFSVGVCNIIWLFPPPRKLMTPLWEVEINTVIIPFSCSTLQFRKMTWDYQKKISFSFFRNLFCDIFDWLLWKSVH